MQVFAFDEKLLEQWLAQAANARQRDPRCQPRDPGHLREQFSEGHPIWQHAEHRLVFDAGARCAAIVNPRLSEDGFPLGQIGWFDAEDSEAAGRVLDAACNWLTQQGVKRVIGPMCGSTWHSYRLVTAWNESRPFLLEPATPEAYPAYWQAADFAVDTHYYSSEQDNAQAEKAFEMSRKRAADGKYQIVHADLAGFDTVLRHIFDISKEVFTTNPYYSPISWEEFQALYRGAQQLLSPELVHWLKSPDGDIVGFGFGYVDPTSTPRRSVFKSMGIRTAHQGKGLAGALFHEQAVQARKLGCEIGIRALMADGNRSFASGRSVHQVIREYALFSRQLSP